MRSNASCCLKITSPSRYTILYNTVSHVVVVGVWYIIVFVRLLVSAELLRFSALKRRDTSGVYRNLIFVYIYIIYVNQAMSKHIGRDRLFPDAWLSDQAIITLLYFTFCLECRKKEISQLPSSAIHKVNMNSENEVFISVQEK